MLIGIALFFLIGLLALGIYASVSIQACIYIKAFCKGCNSKKEVALTFDDGPDPTQTPKVLEVLRRYNVKAAFFCVGDKAKEYPDLVRRIVDEGHIVGNHTYEHNPIFPLFCKVEMEHDLRKTDDILNQITGKKISFFRPPFGVTNPTVAAVVRKLGYKTIGWSIRSLDTVRKFSREQVVKRIESKLHNGGIILLHDNRKNSESLAEAVIEKIISNGYAIKRVDELL